MKIFFLSFFYFVIFINPSFAYIDPGIGSLIIQSLVGGFAIAVGAISVYWNKFKSLINKILKKNKKK